MFCNQCGQSMGDQGRFCTACGAPVQMSDNQAAEATSPMQQPVGPPIFQSAGPIIQRENMSFAKATDSSPAEGILPQMEMVTPADEGPERLICEVKGELRQKKLWPGYWSITNKRIIFSAYDEYKTEEPFQLGLLKDLVKTNDMIIIPTRNIHSIAFQKILGEYTVEFYCYDEVKFTAEINSKLFDRQFQFAMQEAIPSITFVHKTTLCNDYYLNVSELDPRNPFGTRYNPGYPRGYVVAELKKLKNDPHGIDDAINAAKQAGTLPLDWSILVKGIGLNQMPEGVPCLVNATY